MNTKLRNRSYVEDMLDEYAEIVSDVYMQFKPVDIPNYIKETLKDKKRSCYRCAKEFCLNNPNSYAYKQIINGKMRWFCSWTCLSLTRKERKRK